MTLPIPTLELVCTLTVQLDPIRLVSLEGGNALGKSTRNSLAAAEQLSGNFLNDLSDAQLGDLALVCIGHERGIASVQSELRNAEATRQPSARICDMLGKEARDFAHAADIFVVVLD